MVERGPVTFLLLLSIPSTVKLLLRGRCPPTDGPLPAPDAPLVETPELRSDRLITPEPVAVIGRSAIWRDPKVVPTWAVVVSITLGPPLTSTAVAAWPTCSVRFRVAARFS